MAWTYLKFNKAGDILKRSPKLPGERHAYLGFDLLRMMTVIGYTERGGFSSFLGPNVNDDCNIVAWAPLSEKESADIDVIQKNCPFYPWDDGDTYDASEIPLLIR